MMDLIVEAVVISFCVGGALGAIVTLQLLQPGMKKVEVKAREPRHTK